MNKDEILSRHKQENRFGDEREKTIRTRRDAFSLWGVLGLGVVFMGLKIWQGQSPADLVSLFFCMSGLAFVYEGVQLRQKRCSKQKHTAQQCQQMLSVRHRPSAMNTGLQQNMTLIAILNRMQIRYAYQKQ